MLALYQLAEAKQLRSCDLITSDDVVVVDVAGRWRDLVSLDS